MGMPYAAEEITDSTGIATRPSTRKVTAADITGMAVRHVERASDQQCQDIAELFHDRGIDIKAGIAGIEKLLGHDVDGLDCLTSAEAEQVIASLTRSQDQP
jgi:hypothetical protein